MKTRNSIIFAIVFSGIYFLNGCEIADDDLTIPWCEAGTKPCGNYCIDQYDICGSTIEQDEPDFPVSANPDVMDPCDNPDVGCPGFPCAHGYCWNGEEWDSKMCHGVIIDCDGTTVDPGVCCVDHECDAE